MKNNMKMGIKMEIRQKQMMSTRMYIVAGGASIISLIIALAIFFNITSHRDALANGPMEGAGANAGDFRSISNGNWNNATTWEKYDGENWKVADMYPTSTDGMITVRPEHSVVLTSDEIIDQLNVAGSVTLAGNRIILLDGDIHVNGRMTVNGRLMCGTNIIAGRGTFMLGDGATLLIGDSKGITVSGNAGNIQTASRVYSNNANYVYCGTEPQVTGNGLPASDLNGVLTLDNEAGCSLSNNTYINNKLLLNVGALCLNGKTLTVNSQKIVSRTGGSLNLCGGNIALDSPDKEANRLSMEQFISSLAAENTQLAESQK